MWHSSVNCFSDTPESSFYFLKYQITKIGKIESETMYTVNAQMGMVKSIRSIFVKIKAMKSMEMKRETLDNNTLTFLNIVSLFSVLITIG